MSIAVLVVIRRGRTGVAAWAIPASGLALFLLASAAAHYRQERRVASAEEFARSVPGSRDDYVSSVTCQACHPDEHASWHASYHRTMTQVATPEAVIGNFDGVTLRDWGGETRLEQRGDEFWAYTIDPDWLVANKGGDFMNLRPGDRPRWTWKRIAMTTGSHHMQVYWTQGSRPNQVDMFPFLYLRDEQRWIPRRHAFLSYPGAPQPLIQWNETCIQCHATAGQTRPRWGDTFDTQTAELGISCEACHGPAVEHVRANQNPLRRYRQHLGDDADPTIVNPAKLDQHRSSQICGQCHGVAHTDQDPEDYYENGLRYRPGEDLSQVKHIVLPSRPESDPFVKLQQQTNPTFVENHYWSDGMVRVSGREYNGMANSPCYRQGEMTCLSCHSMHDSDPEDQLAEGMHANGACLQCHETIARDLEGHTHHPPESAGSSCYNCHMPHTTYGLLKAIRSHQIDSPTVSASVETGRPNACNLCHLDRSLSWAQEHLADWYGTPRVRLTAEQTDVSAAVTWLLKGDAGQRALVAWSMGWEPAKEASGDEWLAPYLALTFNDPYSAVRFIAGKSTRRLRGYRQSPYDFLSPRSVRDQLAQSMMATWRRRWAGRPGRASAAILLEPDGTLDMTVIQDLIRRRDNRRMELFE